VICLVLVPVRHGSGGRVGLLWLQCCYQAANGSLTRAARSPGNSIARCPELRTVSPLVPDQRARCSFAAADKAAERNEAVNDDHIRFWPLNMQAVREHGI